MSTANDQTIKPILFNTEMVRAILDGKKTQTRRIFKYDTSKEIFAAPGTISLENGLESIKIMFQDNTETLVIPQYKINDILYVRETFYDIDDENIVYRADYPWHWTAIDAVYGDIDTDGEEEWVKWKPSIHMPKKHARIFLKVTNVRGEKLQDMILYDIIKEGFPFDSNVSPRAMKHIKATDRLWNEQESSMVQWWIKLWNSTAKDGYKWEDNPLIPIYDFERILNVV
ncbi:hypothetical protein [Aquamicrobium sp.]|uniref:hypothetical protein n=1 Tax=Aquamicrobium sp. TaxID=1872579 RepID=UPI00258D44F9|nr:hypothetical protein [Aquamicrobium sp.]MCK9549477.1 hypothetical protein [Aquamicrobium sp.]